MIHAHKGKSVRWRDMPLHFKLLVPVTIVNCLITLFLFLAVWKYSTAQLESRLVDDAILLSHTVRSSARSIPDENELSTLLATIGEESRINFIAIADPKSHEIIVATDPTTKDMPHVVIPFWYAFEERAKQPSVSQPWFHFSKHQLQYVSPTFSGEDRAIGSDFVVLIAMDTSKARKEVLSGARSFASALLFCLLALGATTVWCLRIIVVLRVQKIMNSLPSKPSDLSHLEKPLAGLDELSKLSRALYRANSSLGNSFVQLEHHAKQLEATSQKAQIGLWRLTVANTDLRHMTILLSEQGYRLLGIEVGIPFRVGLLLDRLPSGKASESEQSLKDSLESGSAVDLELPIDVGDNTVWLHLSGAVCRRDSKVEAIDGTIQDITESKELAEQKQLLLQQRRQLAEDKARYFFSRAQETRPEIKKTERNETEAADSMDDQTETALLQAEQPQSKKSNSTPAIIGNITNPMIECQREAESS